MSFDLVLTARCVIWASLLSELRFLTMAADERDQIILHS